MDIWAGMAAAGTLHQLRFPVLVLLRCQHINGCCSASSSCEEKDCTHAAQRRLLCYACHTAAKEFCTFCWPGPYHVNAFSLT